MTTLVAGVTRWRRYLDFVLSWAYEGSPSEFERMEPALKQAGGRSRTGVSSSRWCIARRGRIEIEVQRKVSQGGEIRPLPGCVAPLVWNVHGGALGSWWLREASSQRRLKQDGSALARRV